MGTVLGIWLLVICLTAQLPTSVCEEANLSYVPGGDNPILYRPGIDKVTNMDEDTFEDTVFNSSVPVLVEIYKDWCGHCRKFVPVYRAFARSVQNWHSVVKVAAINCADLHNRHVCSSARQYGKSKVPSLKFFPPNTSDYSALQELNLDEPQRTVENVRHLLVEELTDCCELGKKIVKDGPYMDSQKLKGSKDPLKDAWKAVDASIGYVVFVVEDTDANGTLYSQEMALDLMPYKEKLKVVPLGDSTKLPNLSSADELPLAVLYKRGKESPVFSQSITVNTSRAIIRHTDLDAVGSQKVDPRAETPPPVTDCDKEPAKCKKLYFASERDMLKAMHTMLYNEMLGRDSVKGKAYDNLRRFVGLLAQYFPTKTTRDVPRRASSTSLKHSEGAQQIFKDLSSFLDAPKRLKEKKFTCDEWNSTFLASEEKNGFPFPSKDENWEHCQGTSIEFRGYTCGLWTTFHTLTVNYYLAHQKAPEVDDYSGASSAANESEAALAPLKGIQGWVKSFFECDACRRHFMNMTTNQYPLDQTNVNKLDDSFMYLWRAHNIVNKRLHGDATEDPQFTKYQFPAKFLCPHCRKGDGFDEDRVKQFLLQFYRNIKAYR